MPTIDNNWQNDEGSASENRGPSLRLYKNNPI